MHEEPTVLDYIKVLLHMQTKFWEEPATAAPPPQPPAAELPGVAAVSEAEEGAPPARPPKPLPRTPFPWRTLLAFVLGLVAQLFLNQHNKEWPVGLFLYFWAGLALA